MSAAVQGGFDKNSGNNQSAQKQQDKISQITLPVNCFLVNQIRRGVYGGNSNHYELDNTPFENAIITAKFELLDDSQQKIFGRLSDNTGFFQVVVQKPKDSDHIPAYLQAYKDELNNNGQRNKYVRAMIRMRKTGNIQLLHFSIVNDANEITRHSADIIYRTLQRIFGLEEFMAMTAKTTAPAAQKQIVININRNMNPNQQVLEYLRQVIQQSHDHQQVSKRDIVEFFKDRFNGAQINQYLQQLVSDNEIFNIQGSDNYFLNKQD